MGQPYASHRGKVLRIGWSEVNSHVWWTGYEKTRPAKEYQPGEGGKFGHVMGRDIPAITSGP
jgi:hypothetical protein